MVTIVVQELLTGTVVPDDNLTGSVVEDCEAPAFTASLSGPGVQELGAVLASPAFTASYNRPPTSAVLTNNDNAESKDVSPSPTSFTSDLSYSKTTPNDQVRFTLTADDGGAPDVDSHVVPWRARHWFGFHASPGPLTDAQVVAMVQLQTGLSSNLLFDVTFAAVAGLYFHHIWHDFFLPLDPAKYFTDGLFNSGVIDAGAVAVTSTPSAFTARDIRTGLLNTAGSPIRFERRA